MALILLPWFPLFSVIRALDISEIGGFFLGQLGILGVAGLVYLHQRKYQALYAGWVEVGPLPEGGKLTRVREANQAYAQKKNRALLVLIGALTLLLGYLVLGGL